MRVAPSSRRCVARLAAVAVVAPALFACGSVFPAAGKTFYPVCRPVELHGSPAGPVSRTVPPHRVNVLERDRDGWARLETSSYSPRYGQVAETGWIEAGALESDQFKRFDADEYDVCKFHVALRRERTKDDLMLGLPVTNIELLPPLTPKEKAGTNWWYVQVVWSGRGSSDEGWVDEEIFS